MALFVRHSCYKTNRHLEFCSHENSMRDERKLSGVAAAFFMMLLMMAAAGAADSDLRLVDAARSQDLPRVRALLAEHVDVNARSDDGSTALLWAAHWNDVATADLLIRAGADANAANDFRTTPLSQACTNGSAQFVELLLKAGANPDAPIVTGSLTDAPSERSDEDGEVRQKPDVSRQAVG
jgi:ankyrin repeat protein